MRSAFLWLLFSAGWAWARPASFSDGKCRLTFPTVYHSGPQGVVAQWEGAQYRFARTPLKTLDGAQHLAELRRSQLARGGTAHLIRLDGLDGLEMAGPRSVTRVFVSGQVAYRAEVTFSGKKPAGDFHFLRSLRFSRAPAAAYVPQRMARYDTQLREIPVQKCAENLLVISSLLTGFKLQHRKYPSALTSLKDPLTKAYGYRREGGHYLLYCVGHRHPGVPEHYPRTDDALRTLLAPSRPYRPAY